MRKLRIGLATPWNERSAIAQHSSELASEMARRNHDVTILRTEVGDAQTLAPRSAFCPVFHLSDFSDAEMRARFDIVVAQIGNNSAFHGALPGRIRKIDVLGIFHDAFLGHFANGWAGDEETLRALLWDTYGNDSWPKGSRFLDDLEAARRDRPMLEWLAASCISAVAHSSHYLARLSSACPGPTKIIPLALVFPEMPPAPAPWGHLTVAVIGHANPNKRIDQLILAIAASPRLRERCRIRIIGEAPPEMRHMLAQVAEIAGIAPPQFCGWVSDCDLPWTIRDVDVICCLRNPLLEGASGSLLFGMSSNRPTIVTNHGSYAEAPADTVLRCDPAFEARDLMRHLENILDKPSDYVELTKRAKHHVLTSHTPEAYVAALEPFLGESVSLIPQLAARRSFRNDLASFGLSNVDPAQSRIDLTLAQLFRDRD